MDSVVDPASPSGLPLLPLLLWEAPPGLELILAQEGVPFAKVGEPHPWAFRAGRFVLFDGRKVSGAKLKKSLGAGNVAIDLDLLRDAGQIDPFEAIVDDRAALASWHVGGLDLTERIARRDKAAIRRKVVDRLRAAIEGGGGLWARLANYPHPYQSAFNFRADLDEHAPEDYARFSRARRPIADCTTHFVSTHAYGRDEAVLGDLRGLDAQSHGHFHFVYRDPETNRENLARAHALMIESGFAPSGFAAPGGRWNRGLDRVMEGLGYEFSSDFHLGYDDLPFFPWLGDRFSGVLQVPIHPICEGLFSDAGGRDGMGVGEHLAAVVRSKIEAGEPAFVYGHPERRLGRFPEVLGRLAAEIAGEGLLWRVTLTEFARWWRWRAERRWSVVPKGPGRFEVQFDDWDAEYPLALEVHRPGRFASVPVAGPCIPLELDGLAYERAKLTAPLPIPRPCRGPRTLRSAVREALDWETVTPVDELPTGTIAERVKVGLRRWKSRDVAGGRGGKACA